MTGSRAQRLLLRVPLGRRVAPRVVVIGAQKSGTTALFAYLSRHPAVGGALEKGIHYFDHAYARGDGWYRSRFPQTARFRRVVRSLGVEPVGLEVSPYYPFHPLVPARLHGFDSGMRLIVLLRDPVERAFSHWRMSRRRGREPLDLADALAAEPERLDGELERLELDPEYRSLACERYGYLARGRYAEQLERWYEHFPREQLLVLFSADLDRDPDSVMSRTLEFLELPHLLPDRYPRHNVTPGSLEATPAAGVVASLRAELAEADARLERLLGTPLPWS